MNRVIKFRAWDIKLKYMHTGNQYISMELDKDGLLWTKDLLYMQYTGLKDKHGKEIYEGDIVSVVTFGFDAESFTASVVWKNIGFTLSNNRSLMYFGQKGNICDDAEIIGNIYESPELLAKQTA